MEKHHSKAYADVNGAVVGRGRDPIAKFMRRGFESAGDTIALMESFARKRTGDEILPGVKERYLTGSSEDVTYGRRVLLTRQQFDSILEELGERLSQLDNSVGSVSDTFYVSKVVHDGTDYGYAEVWSRLDVEQRSDGMADRLDEIVEESCYKFHVPHDRRGAWVGRR